MRIRRLATWIAIPSAVLLVLGMGVGPLRSQEASGDALKSAKERLSDKASDEQRVNNCRVPPEKRGPNRGRSVPLRKRPRSPLLSKSASSKHGQ